MKQENKRCRGCDYFNAYYTRGYCCLIKENNGYCKQHKKVVEKSDTCNEWRCRRMPRKTRMQIAINAIPEIYKKIAIIEQILKEDYISNDSAND